jgi:hypothetical protein
MCRARGPWGGGRASRAGRGAGLGTQGFAGPGGKLNGPHCAGAAPGPRGGRGRRRGGGCRGGWQRGAPQRGGASRGAAAPAGPHGAPAGAGSPLPPRPQRRRPRARPPRPRGCGRAQRLTDPFDRRLAPLPARRRRVDALYPGRARPRGGALAHGRGHSIVGRLLRRERGRGCRRALWPASWALLAGAARRGGAGGAAHSAGGLGAMSCRRVVRARVRGGGGGSGAQREEPARRGSKVHAAPAPRARPAGGRGRTGAACWYTRARAHRSACGPTRDESARGRPALRRLCSSG